MEVLRENVCNALKALHECAKNCSDDNFHIYTILTDIIIDEIENEMARRSRTDEEYQELSKLIDKMS